MICFLGEESLLIKKYHRLQKFLAGLDSAVIAFSGGVDSGLLAKIAYSVLKNKIIAITANSALYTLEDSQHAVYAAKEIGIKQQTIFTQELENKSFKRNLEDRCYWCKKELFSELKKIAVKNKFKHILDGTNYDDVTKDKRAGLRANKELGVISPFYECEFRSKEIVSLAKHLKLSFWKRPKGTCLASRISCGDPITLRKLETVALAEKILKKFLGADILLRARDHKDILRVETEKRNWTKLKKSDINSIVKKIKKLGYKYVTVDLEGYVPSGLREEER
jgi:uncharacterized protein